MHVLYIFSVWLHILAAAAWLGGMFFLVLVVVPWLRKGARVDAGKLLRETGARFRNVGWACFVVFVVTGSFNLWFRGVRLADLTRAQWLASPFGKTVLFKLALFALVLALSAFHDFVAGPRAIAIMEREPGSPAALAARRRASLLGRANVVLALVLVAAGVMLVRGVPW